MTNFLTGQNTSFEGGIGNWVAGTGTAVADSTARSHSGTASLRMTASTAGAISAVSCNATSITTQGMPVNPGDQVYTGAWFQAGVTSRFPQLKVSFYTSAGALISNPLVKAGGIKDSATIWVFVDGTTVAPATSAFCRTQTVILAAVLNEVHYIDDVVLSRSAGGGAEITRFIVDMFDEMAAA